MLLSDSGKPGGLVDSICRTVGGLLVHHDNRLVRSSSKHGLARCPQSVSCKAQDLLEFMQGSDGLQAGKIVMIAFQPIPSNHLPRSYT